MPIKKWILIGGLTLLTAGTIGVRIYIIRRSTQVVGEPEGEILEKPVSIEPEEINSISQIDVLDWKTYRNQKYGFELKYPKDWKVSVGSGKFDGLPHFESPNFSKWPPEGARISVIIDQLKKYRYKNWEEQVKTEGLASNVYKPIIIHDRKSLRLIVATRETYSEEIIFPDLTKTQIITFHLQCARIDKERYKQILYQILSTFCFC